MPWGALHQATAPTRPFASQALSTLEETCWHSPKDAPLGVVIFPVIMTWSRGKARTMARHGGLFKSSWMPVTSGKDKALPMASPLFLSYAVGLARSHMFSHSTERFTFLPTGLAVWDPTPLYDSTTGETFLFFGGPGRTKGHHWDIWLMTSQDKGGTWGVPRNVSGSCGRPGDLPNPPSVGGVMSRGRALYPPFGWGGYFKGKPCTPPVCCTSVTNPL